MISIKKKVNSPSKNQSKGVKCYNCQKYGHISTECPMEGKSKKKTLVATWDDSSESKSDSAEWQQDDAKNYSILMARTSCDPSDEKIENFGKSEDEKFKSESESESSDDEDPQGAYDRLALWGELQTNWSYK